MSRSALYTGRALLGGLLLWTLAAPAAEPKATEPKAAQAPSGKELFTREWLPHDARSVSGDGLGPMFNESSCVSCHNQGGIGGGGSESKNVQILSVIALSTNAPSDEARGNARKSRGLIASTLGTNAARATQATKTSKEIKAELTHLHPDFAASRSVVLHRFSVDPGFAEWRRQFEPGDMNFFGISRDDVELKDMADVVEGARPIGGNVANAKSGSAPEPGKLGLREAARGLQELDIASARVRRVSASTREMAGFVLGTSQRNTTALYGVGLIDRIPADAILAAAERHDAAFPEVKGRVCKLKNGSIGRFGWKAQQASLLDFTLTACAVEIGLDVPGHPQSHTPHKTDAAEHRLDMTTDQCAALVSFVASLPQPAERVAHSEQEAATLAAGKKHFSAVGCSACHLPQLADVNGMYSDLLLHDMGRELGDVGVYGGAAPNSSDDADEVLPLLAAERSPREPTAAERAKTVGALRQEWRTPPLWGCRDSAPYMHDGRADTLQEAIALHGGEGRRSAIRFFALAAEDRDQLVAFLKSLTAPGL